ncbi:hypothetical protein FOA52_000062 [Chlamydomonas sp. UWO 241]|nr:hypothetical protein FOA52_000062 [Chlamydomonas sp. UWO 241]
MVSMLSLDLSHCSSVSDLAPFVAMCLIWDPSQPCFVLSIPVARGANWFLAGGGRRMDEEEATAAAAAAERIAAAAEDGISLLVRLATDVVRFLYSGTGRRELADGGVVSASLLNAKPAVGGIGVEPRGGGVLRVLFTVASDAVADTVVRWRHELRRCVDSTAVFDVLSDREEAQHQALWPAFLAAKVAGKRVQFHRARRVVDGERATLGILVGDTMLGGAARSLLTGWTFRVAALVGIAALFAKMLNFTRWADETSRAPRFVLWFAVLLAELSIENCMVWLASAVDMRKFSNDPGLQDNVELLVRLSAERGYPALRWLASLGAANVMHFLLAMLALAFSVLWEQVPYSGFGIFSRILATFALSRSLRVVCFMSTVLPSPRPGCYLTRFPPVVPDTVWGLIKAGYTTIRGFGGCNDLIFSGHAAFWVVAPLAHGTYYRPTGTGARLWARASNAAMWVALAQASLRDVVERHHYSVDMIVAVIVTAACWGWTERVYSPREVVLRPRARGAPPDKLNAWLLALIAVCLGAAAVIVIGGKA